MSGPVPPAALVARVGGGDFLAVGEVIFREIVEACGLRPDDDVLDVGCGVGRLAVPLAGYLAPSARYEGFDAWPEGIRWCQEHVTPGHPNFRFQAVNVYNGTYSPSGATQASRFTFPYASAAFDVVILVSVFTHMLPDDLAGYVSEIARVLRLNGRAFITAFLLNPESRRLLEAGRSFRPFPFQVGGCLVSSVEAPEEAVCYPEELIVDCLEGHGLEVVRPIRYGQWCGRARFVGHQDVIVARRSPAAAPGAGRSAGRGVKARLRPPPPRR